LVLLDELLVEILLDDEHDQVDLKICLVDLVEEDSNNLNHKASISKIYSEEEDNKQKDILKQNKNLFL
jgi:hypothetical protein